MCVRNHSIPKVLEKLKVKCDVMMVGSWLAPYHCKHLPLVITSGHVT